MSGSISWNAVLKVSSDANGVYMVEQDGAIERCQALSDVTGRVVSLLAPQCDSGEIAPPSVDEARGIASRMCGSILSQHQWGRFFQAELGEEVLDQLARMPPRDMRRSLMTAFGNARLARRDRLLGVDLPDRGPQRQRMGFMA
jgi:hypothetical protein